MPHSQTKPRIQTHDRYTQWVLMPPDAPAPPPGSHGPPPIPAANEALFKSALGGVLARVGDHNRHVQQAACSALATMLEHAGAATDGGALLPHLPAMLDTAAAALQRYGRRTLRQLLDVLCTVANVVGPALGDPALAQRFMPQVCPAVCAVKSAPHVMPASQPASPLHPSPCPSHTQPPTPHAHQPTNQTHFEPPKRHSCLTAGSVKASSPPSLPPSWRASTRWRWQCATGLSPTPSPCLRAPCRRCG